MSKDTFIEDYLDCRVYYSTVNRQHNAYVPNVGYVRGNTIEAVKEKILNAKGGANERSQ